VKSHERIRRCLVRLSRDKTLTEGDVCAIAYRIAQALSGGGMAALALRHAGFESPPQPNYGFRRGVWLGYDQPAHLMRAELEARREGRQFIADYRGAQARLIEKQFSQATDLVLHIRRIERQLTKEAPWNTRQQARWANSVRKPQRSSQAP
jgi:hypothetical protein